MALRGNSALPGCERQQMVGLGKAKRTFGSKGQHAHRLIALTGGIETVFFFFLSDVEKKIEVQECET